LVKVACAPSALRPPFGAGKARQQQRRQNPENGYYNQQLNERNSASIAALHLLIGQLHGLLVMPARG
jgi:hypothetical protein